VPRPVHFNMHADDPDRAVGFYSDVFGWKFTKWSGPMEYWMIDTGSDQPGINGGMSRRDADSDAAVNTIGVEDIDATVQAVVSAGGAVVRAKSAIPGVGWFAACIDTEGNGFGLMQPDDSAA
jgi:predicted enzyme related to lactoylglutathione lyase